MDDHRSFFKVQLFPKCGYLYFIRYERNTNDLQSIGPHAFHWAISVCLIKHSLVFQSKYTLFIY